MAKRAAEPHAKCKHPWYPGIPFCSLCWCQHNGNGCWPTAAAAEPQWIYSGDGLGTWIRAGEPEPEPESDEEAA